MFPIIGVASLCGGTKEYLGAAYPTTTKKRSLLQEWLIYCDVVRFIIGKKDSSHSSKEKLPLFIDAFQLLNILLYDVENT